MTQFQTVSDGYYRTPHWKQFREAAFAKRGRRCEACGGTRYLQVHHVTYRRLGHERIGDVRILCGWPPNTPRHVVRSQPMCHDKVTALHKNPTFRRRCKPGTAIARSTEHVIAQERRKRLYRWVWRRLTGRGRP